MKGKTGMRKKEGKRGKAFTEIVPYAITNIKIFTGESGFFPHLRGHERAHL